MIEYTEERLVHFLCDLCEKWWSIGDWKDTVIMSCPHCGIRQKVREL